MHTRVNHDKDRRIFKAASTVCFALGGVTALLIPLGVHASPQAVIIPLILGTVCWVAAKAAH